MITKLADDSVTQNLMC